MKKNLFSLAIFTLTAFFFFVTGYVLRAYFSLEHPPISVEHISQKEYAYDSVHDQERQEDDTAVLPKGTLLVASIHGTKYHLPWCSGAKQIKDANKITFTSPQEAESAGYTAAANCPEIKLFAE